MTRPPISVISAAQNASQRLADRHTPFVMNDWYVAAFGEEIKDQLLAIPVDAAQHAKRPRK